MLIFLDYHSGLAISSLFKFRSFRVGKNTQPCGKSLSHNPSTWSSINSGASYQWAWLWPLGERPKWLAMFEVDNKKWQETSWSTIPLNQPKSSKQLKFTQLINQRWPCTIQPSAGSCLMAATAFLKSFNACCRSGFSQIFLHTLGVWFENVV